jgi:hypothetical protein
VRERHVHASRAAEDFDLCIEILRERLDEGCAQAALRRSADGIQFSDPIVGHDKLPVRSVDLVADDNPTVLFVFGKSVFQSVDHEFGDGKAEADGLGGLIASTGKDRPRSGRAARIREDAPARPLAP